MGWAYKKRERPEQVDIKGFVFGLDLLAQTMVCTVVSGEQVGRVSSGKLMEGFYSMIKALFLSLDSGTRWMMSG